MFSFTSLAIMTAAVSLLPSALATFDAAANTNMAVYWGQGPSQKRLQHFCDDDNIDIIPVGFVNVFPDQSGEPYPGTNFGNQCGSETYQYPNGSSSLLLSNCPDIGPDITYCQSKGKKILLSLGGARPNNQHLDSEASAADFAQFLWEAFGPPDNTKTTPRPFGDAVVDGFDFDIENVLAAGESSGDLNRGYATMVNTLRAQYALDKSKQYYISAAPQCIVPDAHLANAIENSPFDFLFVQFYNAQQCSARAYFDHSYGGTNTDISFASWVDFVQTKSNSKKTKVYLGLPAAPDSQLLVDSKMYLQPNEAQELINALLCGYKHAFGGVMIYEATYSENNQINGKSYVDVLKGYLENTQCTVSSSVTSSATLRSTSAISSTRAVSTTNALSTTRTASSVPSASSSAVASSTQATSSVGVQSSSSSIAASSAVSSTSGATSLRSSSLPATSSGSSSPTSSGEVVVSVTEVSTVSRCPSNVSPCLFQSQTATSIASSVSASVYSSTNGAPSSSAPAFTSSVPALSLQGTSVASVSLFTSIPGSIPPSSGASSSGAPYQNATSGSVSSAPTSIVTPKIPAPVSSNTIVSPAPASTEYTSLTTYTTVTSCPVTTTKVQSGTTSIIVETTVITSTITTCPRCSEKTKSVSLPGLSSITPAYPSQVGTTGPIQFPSVTESPSPSGVPHSVPSVVPGGQSSGQQPSPTTYTTTEIVSTLTTTCSEATTFSLSSGGKLYSATAHETLTITDCTPCTLTHKTVGYSFPTNVGSPFQPVQGEQPPKPSVIHPSNFDSTPHYLSGSSFFGTPGSNPGTESTPSKPEAQGSSSSPQAGSSSPSKQSASSSEGGSGSSGASPPSASNGGSQSSPNGGNGASSPNGGSPGAPQTGTGSDHVSANFASPPSNGSPSTPNTGSESQSNGGSGTSSSGSSNNVATSQQSSPEQSTEKGSQSKAGSAGSASKASAQAPGSSIAAAHHPVVTLEIIPVPASPSQTSKPGSSSANGPASGEKSAQQGGQQSGQQNGQQSGQQSGQQNGQQSGQQSGQQNGQQSTGQGGQQSGTIGQSGQQSGISSPSFNNGTAPASKGFATATTPSGTAVAIPPGGGSPNGNPATSTPQEFKGAASRVCGSFFGVMAASAAIALLL